MARLNVRFAAGLGMGLVLGYFCAVFSLALLSRGGGPSLFGGGRARAFAVARPKQEVGAGERLDRPEQPEADAGASVSRATHAEAEARAGVARPKKESVEAGGGGIVFTSGCNLYQHWQAELVFHSHMRVGQRGSITRIVSGCGDGDTVKPEKVFRSHGGGLADEKVPKEDLYKSTNPKARIHMAPDFEGAEAFPWLNKPLGIEHWIKHADPPVVESVIVIIDVDMVFQDRLELGKRRLRVYNNKASPKDGLFCSGGCRGQQFLGESIDGMTDEVKEGRPVAQLYGIGGQWISKYNLKGFLPEDSAAHGVNQQDALQYYQVGPPLMLHRNDLAKLAPLWAQNMEHVMDPKKPQILADMYAYSIAAAHLKLPHLTLDNYMSSSSTIGGGEANSMEISWDPAFRNIVQCSDPWPHDEASYLPTFLHFCQTYRADGWSWHKGRIPPNIFECHVPLLRSPPENLISNQTRGSVEERGARFVCAGTHELNAAVMAYRQKFCKGAYNSTERLKILDKAHGCVGKNKQGVDNVLGQNCWPHVDNLDPEL
eukprot:CAMPEP_0206220406 /NCGR_PEP_ID=MMETSP0047_2-20121206/4861_1 /ASSEMBLY_ACC=CAM_ASM_000192 /TAXON_ID=195065 /ORGANISM="Chroomonas mesostigmatica_cf, Strain CCMP1168" /LENGTH=541 /DNA_ID=CAMNT_0053643065 /DNA_START=124 /DNA_END=1749 /DNA_ORIENTATION=-